MQLFMWKLALEIYILVWKNCLLPMLEEFLLRGLGSTKNNMEKNLFFSFHQYIFTNFQNIELHLKNYKMIFYILTIFLKNIWKALKPMFRLFSICQVGLKWGQAGVKLPQGGKEPSRKILFSPMMGEKW